MSGAVTLLMGLLACIGLMGLVIYLPLRAAGLRPARADVSEDTKCKRDTSGPPYFR